MTSEFVPHPRYGDKPRFTGLDPDPNSADVHLHWNANLYPLATRKEKEKFLKRFGMSLESVLDTYFGTVIKGTAIVANIAKQIPSTLNVTHYYDIRKTCRSCSRPFIFFAEEQKYWYEELRFSLDAQAVKCVPCRKKEQQVQAIKKRYESLFHANPRNLAEETELEMCRVTLVEEGIFHQRQLEHVKTFLKSHPEGAASEELKLRIKALEEKPS